MWSFIKLLMKAAELTRLAIIEIIAVYANAARRLQGLAESYGLDSP